jgi:hypothetical protein
MTARPLTRVAERTLFGKAFYVLDEDDPETLALARVRDLEPREDGYRVPAPYGAHAHKLRSNLARRKPLRLMAMRGPDTFPLGMHAVVEETEQGDFVTRRVGPDPLEGQDVAFEAPGAFRSALEARLQAFFDAVGARAQYETMRILYGPDKREYTVDFWCPDLGLFVELKPTFPTDAEIRLCETLAKEGHNVLLLYGDIAPARQDAETPPPPNRDHGTGMRGMTWDATGAAVAADLLPVWDDVRGFCFDRCVRVDDARWNHPKIQAAFRAAASVGRM